MYLACSGGVLSFRLAGRRISEHLVESKGIGHTGTLSDLRFEVGQFVMLGPFVLKRPGVLDYRITTCAGLIAFDWPLFDVISNA